MAPYFKALNNIIGHLSFYCHVVPIGTCLSVSQFILEILLFIVGLEGDGEFELDASRQKRGTEDHYKFRNKRLTTRLVGDVEVVVQGDNKMNAMKHIKILMELGKYCASW